MLKVGFFDYSVHFLDISFRIPTNLYVKWLFTDEVGDQHKYIPLYVQSLTRINNIQ